MLNWARGPMIQMTKTKAAHLCPECSNNGLVKRLKLFQVGFEDAVYLCENDRCLFPLTCASGDLLTSRKASEIGPTGKRTSKNRNKKASDKHQAYTNDVHHQQDGPAVVPALCELSNKAQINPTSEQQLDLSLTGPLDWTGIAGTDNQGIFESQDLFGKNFDDLDFLFAGVEHESKENGDDVTDLGDLATIFNNLCDMDIDSCQNDDKSDTAANFPEPSFGFPEYSDLQEDHHMLPFCERMFGDQSRRTDISDARVGGTLQEHQKDDGSLLLPSVSQVPPTMAEPPEVDSSEGHILISESKECVGQDRREPTVTAMSGATVVENGIQVPGPDVPLTCTFSSWVERPASAIVPSESSMLELGGAIVQKPQSCQVANAVIRTYSLIGTPETVDRAAEKCVQFSRPPISFSISGHSRTKPNLWTAPNTATTPSSGSVTMLNPWAASNTATDPSSGSTPDSGTTAPDPGAKPVPAAKSSNVAPLLQPQATGNVSINNVLPGQCQKKVILKLDKKTYDEFKETMNNRTPGVPMILTAELLARLRSQVITTPAAANSSLDSSSNNKSKVASVHNGQNVTCLSITGNGKTVVEKASSDTRSDTADKKDVGSSDVGPATRSKSLLSMATVNSRRSVVKRATSIPDFLNTKPEKPKPKKQRQPRTTTRGVKRKNDTLEQANNNHPVGCNTTPCANSHRQPPKRSRLSDIGAHNCEKASLVSHWLERKSTLKQFPGYGVQSKLKKGGSVSEDSGIHSPSSGKSDFSI